MPGREELLQSIQPDMKLTKSFFLRIYGYELTYPGFAGEAIKALEDAGCSRGTEYYTGIISEVEVRYENGMKEAAEWYYQELQKKWKQEEGEERRKEKLREMDTIQLLKLLDSLTAGE